MSSSMSNLMRDFIYHDAVQASCLALAAVSCLTVIRDYFPKKNQWIFTTLLIHGGLLLHFNANCAALDEPVLDETCASPLAPALHDLACGRTGDWKIVGWGNVERVIALLFCFGAVCINVIPKYRKRDLAERHVARIKKSEAARSMSNPLLFHIITGILTVLGSGMAACYGKFPEALLAALVLFDVGHQLSIWRLIPDHDGIWTLRCGNVNLAIVKCIALFRLAEDPQAKVDLVFMYSAGFMYTRVFNFLFGFAHVQWLPKEAWMHEYWYSLGLAGAQFWVQFRTASFSMPLFWFSCICTSVLFYHPLWDKANRNYLTLVNCALFASSFVFTGYSTQVGLCLAYYYLAGFRLPHYHRHRCPRKWRPVSESFSRSNSFAAFITPQQSFAVTEEEMEAAAAKAAENAAVKEADATESSMIEATDDASDDSGTDAGSESLGAPSPKKEESDAPAKPLERANVAETLEDAEDIVLDEDFTAADDMLDEDSHGLEMPAMRRQYAGRRQNSANARSPLASFLEIAALFFQ